MPCRLDAQRRPGAPGSVRALLAAGVALVAGALSLAACSVEGYTPECENNVTKDGILINKTDTPCSNFGQCIGKDGKPAPATVCCVDDDGEPLGGSALTQCLYGFGAVDLDTSGGTGGSGGSTQPATGSGGTGGG